MVVCTSIRKFFGFFLCLAGIDAHCLDEYVYDFLELQKGSILLFLLR